MLYVTTLDPDTTYTAQATWSGKQVKMAASSVPWSCRSCPRMRCSPF